MQWESDHRECVLQGESEWDGLTLTYPQNSVSHPCLVPAKADTPQHRLLSCSDTGRDVYTWALSVSVVFISPEGTQL